jgi:hypothetical protein
MPILIDGNNLLHSLPRDERSRDAVRRHALETVRHEGMRLTVVFDGPPPQGSPEIEHLGQVSVRYSGSSSADDVIMGFLPQSGGASEWVVVTDDRGLRERARTRGARVRTIDQWKSRRTQRPRRATTEPKLSSRELRQWEDFFATGGDAEDA